MIKDNLFPRKRTSPECSTSLLFGLSSSPESNSFLEYFAIRSIAFRFSFSEFTHAHRARLSDILMEIEVNPELLRLIATLERDISEVVHEALTLWLRERILICPITDRFCENVKKSCNECTIAENTHTSSNT